MPDSVHDFFDGRSQMKTNGPESSDRADSHSRGQMNLSFSAGSRLRGTQLFSILRINKTSQGPAEPGLAEDWLRRNAKSKFRLHI